MYMAHRTRALTGRNKWILLLIILFAETDPTYSLPILAGPFTRDIILHLVLNNLIYLINLKILAANTEAHRTSGLAHHGVHFELVLFGNRQLRSGPPIIDVLTKRVDVIGIRHVDLNLVKLHSRTHVSVLLLLFTNLLLVNFTEAHLSIRVRMIAKDFLRSISVFHLYLDNLYQNSTKFDLFATPDKKLVM